MAKISTIDHLRDAMERLMNENSKPEEIQKTLEISKALSSLAKAETDIRRVEIEEKALKLDMLKTLEQNGFIDKNVVTKNIIEPLKLNQ